MYSDITHSYSDFCIFVGFLNIRFYFCTMSFVCTVALCGLTTGGRLILNVMCIGWGHGGLVCHPSISHTVPLPLCKEACPHAGMYEVHHGVKKKHEKKVSQVPCSS